MVKFSQELTIGRESDTLPKTKILSSAFELFSKGHYNSVSLSEIADKAGIKKPSIYAHFASKEDLFLEVFDTEVKRLRNNVNKILNDNKHENMEVMLQQLLIKSIEYAIENAPVDGFWAYLLFVTPHDLPQQISIRIEQFKSSMEKLFYDLILKGIDKGEIADKKPRSIVYFYSCLLQGNLLMELNSNSFDMDKVKESWFFFWEAVKSK